jgi:peptidoglycan/xylan/chitin deacetylase (PgdA/CDA1 family)
LKAILTWHSLDESNSVISTPPLLFERQMETLLARGVRVVPLATLPLLNEDENAVSLTFDDGFANFATAAAPLLQRLRATATVFVVTDLLGTTNAWDAGSPHNRYPALPLMGREEIQRLSKSGFDIGGHGATHCPLSGLPAGLLEAEVKSCAESLEELTGAKPLTFAFPYGAFDERSVDAVSRHFALACTTALGTLAGDASHLTLPRLDMHYFRDTRILERWDTPFFDAYLMTRRVGRRIRQAFKRAS